MRAQVTECGSQAWRSNLVGVWLLADAQACAGLHDVTDPRGFGSQAWGQPGVDGATCSWPNCAAGLASGQVTCGGCSGAVGSFLELKQPIDGPVAMALGWC